jgi:hypothetical protein
MANEDDDIPRIRLLCPVCGTDARVPVTDVKERVDRHNESVHDGESVAGIDPAVADHLLDLIAEDMGIL